MIHVDMRGSEYTSSHPQIKSDYLNDVSAKIGGLQTAASDARRSEGAPTAAEHDRDEYLAAEGFASSDAIGDEATRLEGVRLAAVDLENALSGAEANINAFFGADGQGADFADSAEIGEEAAIQEELAATLPEDSEAAESALQIASELRGLETQAQDLEDAVSAAQGDVDTFFDSGAGTSFANSTEIGDRVAHLEAAQTNAADLEDAAENAQGDLDAFFSGLNSVPL